MWSFPKITPITVIWTGQVSAEHLCTADSSIKKKRPPNRDAFMASLPQSYQCKRHVEERDHDIGYSQVHNEQAGGGVHALDLDDNVTDQDVAEEGEDNDEGVRRDKQGFHGDALRLRSVPAPAHKALPVSQAVIIPRKETRDVRDYKSLLQAPIEGQLSWGHEGINQLGESEPDKTGQHL